MTKRVLVIAPFYPPCTAWPTAARRLSSLASGLEAEGWRAFVIAARYDSTLCDCTGCRDAVAAPDGAVAVSRYVPVRPWRLIPGWSLPGRGSEERLSAPFHQRLAWRATAAARALVPELETSWTVNAIRQGLSLAKEARPDLVWTSSHPFSSATVGFVLSRRLRIPWVAELRDPLIPAADLSRVQEPSIRLLTRRFGSLLRRADAVIEVARDRATRDAAILGELPRVLPSPVDIDMQADATHQHSDYFNIVFAGALYPDREPAAFFRAMRRFVEYCDAETKVRFLYFGRDGGAVRALSVQEGVDALVLDMGFAPRDRVLTEMFQAQVLLLLTSHVGGGGKAWEYLATGRPVVAFPALDEHTRELDAISPAVRSVHTEDEVTQLLIGLFAKWQASGHVPSELIDLTPLSTRSRSRELAAIFDEMVAAPQRARFGSPRR